MAGWEPPGNARERAISLAQKGYAVFRVKVEVGPDGTRGRVRPLGKWREISTSDVARVADWDWKGLWPAIDTGKSGVVVVDLDTKNGVDGPAEWKGAGAGSYGRAIVTTPSGVHLFYRADPERAIGNDSTGKVGRGIDVKGVGGFVFAHGWVEKVADLPELPDVVRQRVGTISATAPPALVPDRIEAPARVFTPGAAEEFCRPAMAALADARPGEVNARFGAAARQIYHFVPAFWTKDDADSWLRSRLAVADRRNGTTDPTTWSWSAEQQLATAWSASRRDWLAEGGAPSGGAGEGAVADSWTPIDMAPVVSGEHSSIMAAIGARDDGVRLLYPGREHVVASEPEAGKTWLLMHIVRTVLAEAGTVVYIDFEDDEGGIGGRMLAAGIPGESIADLSRFRYVRPESVPTSEQYAALLDFAGSGPTLVCLDGVTEGYSLFAGEVNSQESATAWRRTFVRPAMNVGAATLATDHVVKNKDSRGGYAIGAQHKKAGLNGVLFELENIDPFGIGLAGRSKIYIRKDRNGDLRRHGVREKGSLATYFADLSLSPSTDPYSDAPVLELKPPLLDPDHDTDPLAWIKAEIVRRLSERGPLTANELREAVTGAKGRIDEASHALHAAGLICRSEHLSPSGRRLLPWHLPGQCAGSLHPEGVPAPRGRL
jgi:hypothetical protein